MLCMSDDAALFMQAHLTLCQETHAGQACGVCTIPEGLCSLGSSQGSSRLFGGAGEHHLQSKICLTQGLTTCKRLSCLAYARLICLGLHANSLLPSNDVRPRA